MTAVAVKPEPVVASAARDVRRLRLVAIVTGLVGFALALATPLLPVRQEAASIDWPQAGAGSVAAPLVSYSPLTFRASVPCSAASKLPATGGVLLSTVPGSAPNAASKGLVITVADGTLTLVQRDIPLLSTPAAGCGTIEISSTATRTTVTGAPVVEKDVRPQVVGIFTDLPATELAGMRATATVDSRFSTSPTWLKALAMTVAVLATLAALVALHRLDGLDGRKDRRFLPAHWLRITMADVVVLGTLGVWHVIGANTSDDGYILNMARASEHSGYLANYYRWFGVPEAPFGWSYDVLSWLSQISTASVWMRLPALLAGVLCWLVISREVLPRLGVAVRGSGIARWTAGMVFLACWLPYNNGLRPEPLIAVGALLTWCSMERAIATGRVLPAAVAVVIAAFSLAAGPSGLICVAALLAGSRPVLQHILARGNGLATWAPLLAAGTIVLTAVFGGQTLASVLEATRVRTAIGPNVAWFDEYTRWSALLSMSPDGALARRFGILLMLLCLVVCVMQVLRKGGRIPGAAKGPANRILGIVFAAMLLMMFTPTKWTHHFGVYAGLAGALAALTAIAVSNMGIRSRRNRAVFASAVLFVIAISFTGINGWWYVSSYGVPWWDKPPSVHGKGFSTAFLGLAVVALVVAAWHHYREPWLLRQRTMAARHSGTWSVAPWLPRSEKRRLHTRVTPAPLLIGAALVVLFEVASLAKGAMGQRDAYSVAGANLAAIAGRPCALADRVLVESDPNAAMLPLLPGQKFTAGATGFVGGQGTAAGVAPDLTADPDDKVTGGANTVEDGGASKTSMTTSAGTGDGEKLPFGLNATTPVSGSYVDGPKQPAAFTSGWYRLERRQDAPLLVLTAAGRIKSVDVNGVERYGQDVLVEYGTGDGQVLGSLRPLDIGPSPSWRNLRVPMAEIPAAATAVRIVAKSDDLTERQWVAVTPPRVPSLATLQSVVGSSTPVLLDWHVGLAFPCQRPFGHRDGVAEIPQYRILPDRGGQDAANHWQDGIGGGPLGWTGLLLAAQSVPTYLDNDWRRDWGVLERFTPRAPSEKPAELTVTTQTVGGLHSDGPMLIGG